MSNAIVHLGEAPDVLRTLPSGTFDVVLTDPPYPCIKRSYGYWTEAEWFALMRQVVPECMRVLKPTGSAVFILQPNSERVGRMRTWLWEFMAWVGKEWGIVQDAYWWNYSMIPEAHAIQGRLMRPSAKSCVWVGNSKCHRNQEAVLWSESERNIQRRLAARCGKEKSGRSNRPSGHGEDVLRCTESAERRGGVTPFNVLPIANANGTTSAGAYGHGAGTPLALCSWWTRYLCPPGGRMLDPFCGSGTVGVAAVKHGASFIGIDRVPEYVETSRKRIAEAQDDVPLFREAS